MEQLWTKYEFRRINKEEAEEAARIEAVCFPPSEACTLPIMRERIELAGDCFLAAVEKKSGRMAGFVNGLCTDEDTLRDELFTDTRLHNPKGRNICICSVAVLPEHRGQKLAKQMMKLFLEEQRRQGREKAILTCVPEKVVMYQKFGFMDRGMSRSQWGGEVWHEMDCILDQE